MSEICAFVGAFAILTLLNYVAFCTCYGYAMGNWSMPVWYQFLRLLRLTLVQFFGGLAEAEWELLLV